MAVNRMSVLAVLFSVLAITGRVLSYIMTPLWLDYFRVADSPQLNLTNTTDTINGSFPSVDILPSGSVERNINLIFVLVGQWAVTALIFGMILLIILMVAPHHITEVDRKYPKSRFLVIGFAQAVSSLLSVFSVSGTRTAPYLQALLANCNIPIQFTTRYLILRKRSSWLKIGCAVAVVMAEVLCLLPTIFPSLESSSEHQTEGGDVHGAGRFLWPICFVLSQVPYAVANTLMEKGVQEKQKRPRHIQDEDIKDTQVNLVFFVFWWSFCVTLCSLALFWTDLIPSFGTSPDIHVFAKTLSFNSACLFGDAECGASVYMLGWGVFFGVMLAAFSFAGLMRYSEGANFVIIVLTLRSPLVFIFWTLFEESPFKWDPHVALSTWLSLAAIIIMLPAIIIYNIGLPCRRFQASAESAESPDRRGLLEETGQGQSEDDIN